jgi:serine/threonine protein kinase
MTISTIPAPLRLGPYELLRRIATGGMAEVYVARRAGPHGFQKIVALKRILPQFARDADFVAMFVDEARVCARLGHPNIVQVFDFGFDERQRQHYIVMEHVPGHSCAELLRDHGPMEVEQAVDVITQACRGLDYAHRNGVVHRDVKPGNLLVSDSDVVKLADFGIARALDQSSITQVGSVLGTAAYLAPEQARGEEAGARADLYSLGVVSYQLLTGRLPYEANSLSELAIKQQRDPPTPLDELNPRVPPELADAIELALALDKEERPATAMLLAEAIANGARGIEPAGYETQTRRMGGTAATRVLSGGVPTAQTRVAPSPGAPARARQLEPRRAAYPPPVGDYGPAEARRAPAERSGGSRAARRFLAFLAVVVLFVAAVAVAVTISASTSSNVVHFRRVVARDANDAVQQFQSLINQYTK